MFTFQGFINGFCFQKIIKDRFQKIIKDRFQKFDMSNMFQTAREPEQTEEGETEIYSAPQEADNAVELEQTAGEPEQTEEVEIDLIN